MGAMLLISLKKDIDLVEVSLSTKGRAISSSEFATIPLSFVRLVDWAVKKATDFQVSLETEQKINILVLNYKFPSFCNTAIKKIGNRYSLPNELRSRVEVVYGYFNLQKKSDFMVRDFLRYNTKMLISKNILSTWKVVRYFLSFIRAIASWKRLSLFRSK